MTNTSQKLGPVDYNVKLSRYELWRLSDIHINAMLGEQLGWVRYPDDAVEDGWTFHLDRSTAPYGDILPVKQFTATTDWNWLMPIIGAYRIPINLDYILQLDNACKEAACFCLIYLTERDARLDQQKITRLSAFNTSPKG